MENANCWQFKKCGREPNGLKSQELGVCPASIEKSTDGINNGINGGRCCWAVAGTFCGGNAQGSFVDKALDCIHCDFFQSVKTQSGNEFSFLNEALSKLDKTHLSIQKTDSV